MKKLLLFVQALVVFSFLFSLSCADKTKTIYGTWKINRQKSTDIVNWRYRQIEMVIQKKGEAVVLVQNSLEKNKVVFVDSATFIPGGEAVHVPVTSQIWPENWFMGVLAKTGTDKTIRGSWKEPDRELEVVKEQTVEISQGDAKITTVLSFKLNRNGNNLIVIEKRSSRPTPVKLVFDRVKQ
ncbi:MAG: hypothetical protein GXO75_17895 [Calditrichaeota bacterium]|nr:hypothetical protein [Calditrichota bacterium]